MNENRNENGTLSAQELLPPIEDDALLDAVRGGAEAVHLFLKANGRFFPVDGPSPRMDFIANGGVTHEDT